MCGKETTRTLVEGTGRRFRDLDLTRYYPGDGGAVLTSIQLGCVNESLAQARSDKFFGPGITPGGNVIVAPQPEGYTLIAVVVYSIRAPPCETSRNLGEALEIMRSELQSE